jgi:hypothetical protein
MEGYSNLYDILLVLIYHLREATVEYKTSYQQVQGPMRATGSIWEAAHSGW